MVHPSIRFLDGRPHQYLPFDPATNLPVTDAEAAIFIADRPPLVEQLATLYPTAQHTTFRMPNGVQLGGHGFVLPPEVLQVSRGVAARYTEPGRHRRAPRGRARLRLDVQPAAAGPVRRDLHRHPGRPGLRSVPARAPGAFHADADPGRRRRPLRRRERRAAARARQAPAPAERHRPGPGAGPPALGPQPSPPQPIPGRFLYVAAGRDDRAARPGSTPARRRPASRASARSIRTSTSRSTSCRCRDRTPSSGAARSGSSSPASTASASATSARSRSGSTTSCWPRASGSGFAYGEIDLDAGWHDIQIRFVDRSQLRRRHRVLAAARPPARDHPHQRAATLAGLAGRGSPPRRRRHRRARRPGRRR